MSDAEIPPDHFRCAMCGGIFRKGWSEEEAVAEAIAQGFVNVPLEIVCDDCYATTPWGGAKD